MGKMSENSPVKVRIACVIVFVLDIYQSAMGHAIIAQLKMAMEIIFDHLGKGWVAFR